MVFFIAPDFSLGIPRLKPRVINFSPMSGGKYVRRALFIAPDFSLGIPRLKPRVINFSPMFGGKYVEWFSL
jgi:hypothetical protein